MSRHLRRIRLLEREMAKRKGKHPWRVPEIFEQQDGETLEAFRARVDRERREMEERNPKFGVMPVMFIYDDGTEPQHEMVERNGILECVSKGDS